MPLDQQEHILAFEVELGQPPPSYAAPQPWPGRARRSWRYSAFFTVSPFGIGRT
jgi:hypothetical protein